MVDNTFQPNSAKQIPSPYGLSGVLGMEWYQNMPWKTKFLIHCFQMLPTAFS